MSFLQCPNADCASHGPFEVIPMADGNGHSHKVLKCPLCNTVMAVLEPQQAVQVDAHHDQALLRLESAMRSIQSNLTHLRSQLSNLQGRMSRRG